MKIDVAVCVWGKPFQTLRALFTLMKHSGQHVKRIFFQEEACHPFGDMVHWVPKVIKSKYPNVELVHFKNSIARIYMTDYTRIGSEEYRRSMRYQRAWEDTDTPLFLFHNDVIFTKDEIGTMTELMTPEYVGVGIIGQCWNCPAHNKGCHGGQGYEEYDPTYEEFMKLIDWDFDVWEGHRTNSGNVDKGRVMPLPECRLNEFACLIDVPRLKHEVMPTGTVKPFGDYQTDFGARWFRELVLKGYRFKHYSYDAQHKAGDPVSHNENLYWDEEHKARMEVKDLV